MPNLKTLKDYTSDALVIERDMAFMLRQEVIKRWKEFRKEYMSEKNEKKRIHIYGRMEEIKEFFNLNEEDLK